MTKTYNMRNKFVLIRRMKQMVRGLQMPDGSATGTYYIVEAVGPKVEDLKVGMEVQLVGQIGQEFAKIPDEPDLLLSDEAFIPYSVTGGEETRFDNTTKVLTGS